MRLEANDILFLSENKLCPRAFSNADFLKTYIERLFLAPKNRRLMSGGQTWGDGARGGADDIFLLQLVEGT